MSFRVFKSSFLVTTLSLAMTVSVVNNAKAQSGTSSSGSSSKPAAGSSSKPAGSGTSSTAGSNSRPATSGSSGSATNHAGSGSKPAAGSSNRALASAAAIDGFCSVCIVDSKKWQKGSPAFSAPYDGKTYHFPGEEQRATFLANPAKYAPALGGDCAVCLVDQGKRVPGSVQHAALSEGRLFLFPDAGTRRKFLDNPSRYTNADLAFNGECGVCRVDLRKNVPGDPAFTSVHGGMRYQFMSAEQQQTFVSNPAKYAVAIPAPAGSSSRAHDGSSSRSSTSGSSSKPASGSNSRSSGSSSKPASGSNSRSSGSSSKPASGSGTSSYGAGGSGAK